VSGVCNTTGERRPEFDDFALVEDLDTRGPTPCTQPIKKIEALTPTHGVGIGAGNISVVFGDGVLIQGRAGPAIHRGQGRFPLHV
jgi:hypothetical protein